jgi:hypothetical protein
MARRPRWCRPMSTGCWPAEPHAPDHPRLRNRAFPISANIETKSERGSSGDRRVELSFANSAKERRSTGTFRLNAPSSHRRAPTRRSKPIPIGKRMRWRNSKTSESSLVCSTDPCRGPVTVWFGRSSRPMTLRETRPSQVDGRSRSCCSSRASRYATGYAEAAARRGSPSSGRRDASDRGRRPADRGRGPPVPPGRRVRTNAPSRHTSRAG